MQEIIFIFYARVFYTFSTVFNKVMNIVFIFEDKRIPNIRKMSELRKLKITEMNRLTVEEFKEVDKLPLVVVLDEVRSLHNIGAVFRTSDAFLVNCIYLCGITATPPHPEMHKTALGAEYTVDWKYFKRTQDAVNELHNDGYTVLAIEQCAGSTLLDELVLEKGRKYAIVLGNEVKGVQKEVVDIVGSTVDTILEELHLVRCLLPPCVWSKRVFVVLGDGHANHFIPAIDLQPCADHSIADG